MFWGRAKTANTTKTRVLMVCMGSTPRTYERAEFVRMACGISPR